MSNTKFILLALVCAAIAHSQAASACTKNADCGSDGKEYCQMCRGGSSEGTCTPYATHGASCGGYVLCPPECGAGLVCQEHIQPQGAPIVSDVPGICCESVACPADCGTGSVIRRTDAKGCVVSCACEEDPAVGNCAPNMHFNACGSACPPTCEQPNPQVCMMLCRVGCECDAGFYLHNGDCILPSECPNTTETSVETTVEATGDPAAAVTGNNNAEGDSASTTAPAAAPTSTGRLVGGGSPIDPTSTLVQDAAACAVTYVNQNAELASEPMVLSSIVSGTQQVVAGVSFNLVLNLHPASCATPCTAASSQLQYSASIWIRPWATPSCTVNSVTLLTTASTAAPTVVSTAGPTTAPPIVPTTAAPVLPTSNTAGGAGSLPGGLTPVDPTNTDVLAAASCAVQQMNAQSNSMFKTMLVELVSGTQQVVAGMKYTLLIRTGLSSCRNNGVVSTLAECPVNGAAQTYKVVVVVQPWLGSSCTLSSFTIVAEPTTTGSDAAATTPTTAPTSAPTATPESDANPSSKSVEPSLTPAVDPTPALVGGASPIADLSAPEVQAAALCAVQYLNGQSNSIYQMQLVSVLSGTQQVVAGMLYFLSLQTALSTTCLNSASSIPNLANCPVDAKSGAVYSAKVLVQPWMTPSCSVTSTTVESQGPLSTLSSSSSSSSSSPSSTSPSSTSRLTIALGAVLGVVGLATVAVGIVVAMRRRTLSYNPPPTPTGTAREYALLQDEN